LLEFRESEVAAYATQASVLNHAAETRRLYIHQRTKAIPRETAWRTQLDHLKSAARNLMQGALEILSDRLAKRIGLASNGHSQRVGFGLHRRCSDAQAAAIKKLPS
jgi:hypothetical protein